MLDQTALVRVVTVVRQYGCSINLCCQTVLQTDTRVVTRLRQHHLLHSTGSRPAAGSGRLHCCGARGARRLRLHHLLHSAGCRPAAGSCRLQGFGARGGSLAPTTPSSAICGVQSGCRPRPVAGLLRVRARRIRRKHLLHSAGRRPAAGFGRLPSCSALGVPAPTTPCSVICEQLFGNRLRLAVGGCPPLLYMALPPPSNRITTSHTCTIHLMGPTPTPIALSGESIHSSVGQLSFFLRP
jgi:hypothetical protein